MILNRIDIYGTLAPEIVNERKGSVQLLYIYIYMYMTLEENVENLFFHPIRHTIVYMIIIIVMRCSLFTAHACTPNSHTLSLACTHNTTENWIEHEKHQSNSYLHGIVFSYFFSLLFRIRSSSWIPATTKAHTTGERERESKSSYNISLARATCNENE